ncbi:MAG: hypothetical protein CVU38_03760 [Chloroflexi bacterium HGW-Chloroflexi-1]|nr:MAG: hypothetical protein CVU38_03760 [Chloroflexi bacterium HGW-Chloroflexi-1]
MSEEERTPNPIKPTELPQENAAAVPASDTPEETRAELPAAGKTEGEDLVQEKIETESAGAFELPAPTTEPVDVWPTPSVPSKAPASDAPDVTNDDRLMAALAWVSMVIIQLPVVSIVLLLAQGNKERAFQRYHAITSTLFWVVTPIYEILAAIVYTILTVITLGCLGLFLWVIFFLPHLIALYYAYQAYNGKEVEIPVISDFARNQGWA